MDKYSKILPWWNSASTDSFIFLFGENEIYRSNGYIRCNNKFKFINYKKNVEEIKEIETAHYFPLGNESWPESIIDIQGTRF